jgi:methylmalonyl-CoA mutase
MIWAKLVKQFEPKDDKSLASELIKLGLEFNGARSFNNVARTCIESSCRFWRNTTLHTNALDEAIALPTDFSARIARNTTYLQEETKITKPILGLEVIM